LSKYFNIPETLVKDIFSEAKDYIINNWGKNCTLHYISGAEDCNCNVKPEGFDNHPFHEQGYQHGCPYCGGSGKRSVVSTEVVKLRIIQDPKQFRNLVPEELKAKLQVPQSIAFTIGFAVDLPKVMKCEYIILNSDANNINPNKYRRYGKPIDGYSIVQSRYFTILWERIE